MRFVAFVMTAAVLGACGASSTAKPPEDLILPSEEDDLGNYELPPVPSERVSEVEQPDPDRATFHVTTSERLKSEPEHGSKIKPTHDKAAMRFSVVDKDKGPIEGIVISMTAPSGARYYTQETDAEGYAEVLVPAGSSYEVKYLSLGRKEIAATVPVSDEPNQSIHLTLRYRRIDPPKPPEPEPEEHFVLEGVEFDTGKATLRPASFRRLDEVVEYLQHKPDLRLEISGHTDDRGSEEANKALSERRAEACRDYLVRRGVDPSRLQAAGYGAERPIASNDTPEGRQRNRRIEASEL
jgi:outer membrane protein OmpA-like peptidoglycan-associated protein